MLLQAVQRENTREQVAETATVSAATHLPDATVEAYPTPDKETEDKGFLQDQLKKFRHEVAVYRKHSIQAAPEVLVNHSSNLIPLVHITGDLIMFRANGTNFLDPISKEHPQRLWHDYIFQPPKNVWKSVTKGLDLHVNPKEILSPKAWWRNLTEFADTEKATARTLLEGKPFINQWQARGTFLSLGMMGVATVIPEKKEDKKELEDMALLWNMNPLGYIGKRLYQAVDMTDWSNHKRQLAGLGILATGTCSMLGGLRNISGDFPNQRYVFNGAYSTTGMITAAAGASLLFSLANDQGWSRYGGVMAGRIPFLPKSIANKYSKNDPRANWYSLGMATFQTENVVAMMLGGAEKHDGVIVDHEEMRNRIVKHAKEEKETRRHAKEVEKIERIPLNPERVVSATEAHQTNQKDVAEASGPTPHVQEVALQARVETLTDGRDLRS